MSPPSTSAASRDRWIDRRSTMSQKTALSLAQRDGAYVVTKLVNRTLPVIGAVLSQKQVQALIANERRTLTVTITA